MSAADPRCHRCSGKGSFYGQRCDCVDRRLREALELVLMFHSGEPWTDSRKLRWREIVGDDNANSRAMCDHIREILEEED
jgi:hypothetical protein